MHQSMQKRVSHTASNTAFKGDMQLSCKWHLLPYNGSKIKSGNQRNSYNNNKRPEFHKIVQISKRKKGLKSGRKRLRIADEEVCIVDEEVCMDNQFSKFYISIKHACTSYNGYVIVNYIRCI